VIYFSDFSTGGGVFDPADLFNGGLKGAWYDASDLTTLWQDTAGTTPVTTDGQSVARWDDKSGNGNNLLQSTSGFRPVYRTSGGLHWVDFAGGDDRLSSAAFASSIAQPLTVCGAWKTDVSGNQVLCDGLTSGGRVHITRGDPPDQMQIYAGTLTFINDSSGGATVIGPVSAAAVETVLFNGASSTYRRNAVAKFITGTNPGTNPMDGVKLGTWQGETSGFLDGRVYQFFVREGTVAGTDRSNLETYIGAKCGLTI
jgi:hypothetical protein